MAAAITPTVVQRRVLPTTVVYGSSERRMAELFLQGPKATKSDWFLLSSYMDLAAEGAKVISFHGIVEEADAASGACSAEPFTYTQTTTAANAKLVCPGNSTGTVSAFVYYYMA